jgi:hypothetical protein
VGNAKGLIEDEANDLAAIGEGYVEAIRSGKHAGRRIDREAAKTFARHFQERADAVQQMAQPVYDLIMTRDNSDLA